MNDRDDGDADPSAATSAPRMMSHVIPSRLRSMAATATLLVACASGSGEPSAQTTAVAPPSASLSSAEAPAPPPPASATAHATASPELAGCEPSSPPAGYEDCEAMEVIDGPPCELQCWRKREVPANQTDRCCEHPVTGAIFGKSGLLVQADACKYVDPSCAHFEIKSVEARFRHYSDSKPPEVLLVQGGCEMRAMGHGYVPQGVAAWTGCPVAKRFRWDGARFILVP